MSEAQAQAGQDQNSAAQAAAAAAAANNQGNTNGAAGTNGAASENGAANGVANGAAAEGANGTANGAAGARTIAAGGEGQQEPAAKPYWPVDWRQKVAEHVGAGDEKAIKRELKRLERFTDPNGIYSMSRELESKFTSGKLVALPGKDASPEDVQAFHKALGVPEKPEDYFKDIKLESGAVIGDADKPVVDGFAAAVHKAGATPQVVSAALNWYFNNQEQQAAQLDEMDDKFRRESEQALKNEYGPAFKRKVNAISSLFARAPGGLDVDNPGSLISRLMAGRTADGKIIGNDPEVNMFLVSLAQEINPAATVVEDVGGGAQSVESEIASIEKRMREDRRGYNKDVPMQSRYRELLETRTKIQVRQRA